MEILKKTKKGFTLIEVMVSITIFSIVSLFVVDIYVEISKVYFNSLSNRSAQQNVKIAMETITRYVKQSSVADWNNATKTLVLKPKDDVGGVLNTVIFQLNSNIIKMGIGPGNIMPTSLTNLTSENLVVSQFNVDYSVGVPAIVKITITSDIDATGKSVERGTSGANRITMSTETALKAQYNF